MHSALLVHAWPRSVPEAPELELELATVSELAASPLELDPGSVDGPALVLEGLPELPDALVPAAADVAGSAPVDVDRPELAAVEMGTSDVVPDCPGS